MNDLQKVERANRAKRMLESDEWLGAWEAYRKTLLSIIESPGDDEKALDARRMLLAAHQAKRHLETLITDGLIAAGDLNAVKSRLRLT